MHKGPEDQFVATEQSRFEHRLKKHPSLIRPASDQKGPIFNESSAIQKYHYLKDYHDLDMTEKQFVIEERKRHFRTRILGQRLSNRVNATSYSPCSVFANSSPTHTGRRVPPYLRTPSHTMRYSANSPMLSSGFQGLSSIPCQQKLVAHDPSANDPSIKLFTPRTYPTYSDLGESANKSPSKSSTGPPGSSPKNVSIQDFTAPLASQDMFPGLVTKDQGSFHAKLWTDTGVRKSFEGRSALRGSNGFHYLHCYRDPGKQRCARSKPGATGEVSVEGSAIKISPALANIHSINKPSSSAQCIAAQGALDLVSKSDLKENGIADLSPTELSAFKEVKSHAAESDTSSQYESAEEKYSPQGVNGEEPNLGVHSDYATPKRYFASSEFDDIYDEPSDEESRKREKAVSIRKTKSRTGCYTDSRIEQTVTQAHASQVPTEYRPKQILKTEIEPVKVEDVIEEVPSRQIEGSAADITIKDLDATKGPKGADNRQISEYWEYLRAQDGAVLYKNKRCTVGVPREHALQKLQAHLSEVDEESAKARPIQVSKDFDRRFTDISYDTLLASTTSVTKMSKPSSTTSKALNAAAPEFIPCHSSPTLASLPMSVTSSQQSHNSTVSNNSTTSSSSFSSSRKSSRFFPIEVNNNDSPPPSATSLNRRIHIAAHHLSRYPSFSATSSKSHLSEVSLGSWSEVSDGLTYHKVGASTPSEVNEGAVIEKSEEANGESAATMETTTKTAEAKVEAEAKDKYALAEEELKRIEGEKEKQGHTGKWTWGVCRSIWYEL